MGGVCAVGKVKNKTELEEKDLVELGEKGSGFSGKLKSMRSFGRHKHDPYAYPDMEPFEKITNNLYDSSELLSISGELKQSTPARTGPAKASQVSSFFGKAGIVGLEKAVDVLDTLGSSMSNLNSGGGFASCMDSRENKISILAFEVANTIAKGSNLIQSLSEENIQFLKKEILHSEGVQQLVSTDMKELLRIAAADKREEFDVFSREVIRFGDLCKDPQWHNLGRYFSKLDSDFVTNKQLREDAERTVKELTTLAQPTSELYHDLHTLDRFEQDYRRKVEEMESLNLPLRGEGLMILQSELKHQRKLVRSLKKKSLWSKSLEEVVEKFVDTVTFIHQKISEAFEENGSTFVSKEHNKKPERLGAAGLALHYANIITQIHNIASRQTSLPPNMRDALYHGLPTSVKTSLRSRLQTVYADEELAVPQIKAEMEKTLHWLVPVATDTIKAHQGFGWVGEWANTGNEFGKKNAALGNLVRLQTLYHADKKKMDQHILELVTWLQRLISLVRYRDKETKALPVRSPTCKGMILHAEIQPFSSLNKDCKINNIQISAEDRDLLEEAIKRRRLVHGKSKSQEFTLANKKRGSQVWALSRSTGNSPRREWEQPRPNVLDVLDGLDTAF